jgi:hypothetical protein
VEGACLKRSGMGGVAEGDPMCGARLAGGAGRSTPFFGPAWALGRRRHRHPRQGQMSSLQVLRPSSQRLLALATADGLPGTVKTYGRIMAKRTG